MDGSNPRSLADSEYAHRDLTGTIIGAAMDVHTALGPGLLESAYEACLALEFTRRGLAFRRQVELPISYKGDSIDCAFRLDFLVEETVIVELKSIEKLIPIHEAQLLTYMKLAGVRIGLLMNFNVMSLKTGIIRRIL